MINDDVAFDETSLVTLKRNSGISPFRITGRERSEKYGFESFSLSTDDEGLAVVHAVTTEPSAQGITELCRDVILASLHLGPSSAISLASTACRKSWQDRKDSTAACVSAIAIKRTRRDVRVAAVGSLLCYAIEDCSFRALALPQITSSGLLFNYLNSPRYKPVPEKSMPWPEGGAGFELAFANRDISMSVSPEELSSLFAKGNSPETALLALGQICRKRRPDSTPLMAIREVRSSFDEG